ncbi:hypothetical protein HHK36_007497 [Tetracentron sinense]|uniref:Uncharacterized protein n=1 Tax=Tetracentron sinense TaxID=13715 RepID=A0A835DLB6_TETSI|nr:hypothetical protein HHK36_007497 [Tetracentron sinense]
MKFDSKLVFNEILAAFITDFLNTSILCLPLAVQKNRASHFANTIQIKDQLIGVLKRNNRMLNTQLKALNINCQLDRDQQKDHTDSLVSVLSKLAYALRRIADKL